jgi:hypothetical protein
MAQRTTAYWGNLILAWEKKRPGKGVLDRILYAAI